MVLAEFRVHFELFNHIIGKEDEWGAHCASLANEQLVAFMLLLEVGGGEVPRRRCTPDASLWSASGGHRLRCQPRRVQLVVTTLIVLAFGGQGQCAGHAAQVRAGNSGCEAYTFEHNVPNLDRRSWHAPLWAIHSTVCSRLVGRGLVGEIFLVLALRSHNHLHILAWADCLPRLWRAWLRERAWDDSWRPLRRDMQLVPGAAGDLALPQHGDVGPCRR